MSERISLDTEELDERKFIRLMAGQSFSEEVEDPKEILGLTNLHNESYLEKTRVHPLSYSPDFKNHPDLIMIPSCYKFAYDLEKKYQELL